MGEGDFCFQLLASSSDKIMADLSQLPFALSELSWDKLPLVMEHVGLSKEDACRVMTLVLGAPSVTGNEHVC